MEEEDRIKKPALRFPAIDVTLEPWFDFKKALKDRHGLQLGVHYTATFQGASDSLQGLRRIVATITAFTLAHSLTLAGATLGLVHIPGPPIEAAIALSIVFIASEIFRSRQGSPGLTESHPWVVAFTFGLLHGLGFAGALSEIGLPQTSIPIALAFFNVGVELGQLLFITVVIAVIALSGRIVQRIIIQQPTWVSSIPPYAIGGVAAFWVIQRVSSFI